MESFWENYPKYGKYGHFKQSNKEITLKIIPLLFREIKFFIANSFPKMALWYCYFIVINRGVCELWN